MVSVMHGAPGGVRPGAHGEGAEADTGIRPAPETRRQTAPISGPPGRVLAFGLPRARPDGQNASSGFLRTTQASALSAGRGSVWNRCRLAWVWRGWLDRPEHRPVLRGC